MRVSPPKKYACEFLPFLVTAFSLMVCFVPHCKLQMSMLTSSTQLARLYVVRKIGGRLYLWSPVIVCFFQSLKPETVSLRSPNNDSPAFKKELY